MASRRRELRERLERRAHHLEERISTGKFLGEELHYDKAEVSALRWILQREDLLKEACLDLMLALANPDAKESAISRARIALEFGDSHRSHLWREEQQ